MLLRPKNVKTERWRLLLALTNALLAASLLALAGWALLGKHPARGLPARPKPLPYVPAAPPKQEELVQVVSRELDARPIEGPTAAEDRRALADPERDFAASYKVLLAAFDPDPRVCRCIVVPRASGEQVTLAPGERIGGYLLLSIQQVPGEPRGARLRFSDLDHGAILSVTLAPAP
jgi:hypothetical protein